MKKFRYNPKYKRVNGLWVLDIARLPLPAGFSTKENNLVYLPPGEFGGNNNHPRTEAFIGIGADLFLVWEDENGTHTEMMSPEPNLSLFIVPSLTPHAVINRSTGFAILLDFANDSQHDVQTTNIIDKLPSKSQD